MPLPTINHRRDGDDDSVRFINVSRTVSRNNLRFFPATVTQALQMMPAVRIRPLQALLIVLALAIGLAIDVRTDLAGQALVGISIWAVMMTFLVRYPAHERFALMACLAIATAGELVLSLGWGLYTYRLGNIPAFVPPGHVLMFMLGLWLSERITDETALFVAAGAGLYAAAAAVAGIDTFAALLFFVIALAWVALPMHRRLYASTFAASLALEIYGTSLGVWSWALEVPGLPLVTTNPPGTVGAFYCALDALVVTAVLIVLPAARRRCSATAA